MFPESHQNLSFPVSLYFFCLQENGMKVQTVQVQNSQNTLACCN